MQNDLIKKVADLMTEQAAAYVRLETATQKLSNALMQGNLNLIESLTKAGEAELTRMRSRLLEITSTLTNFAASRASNSGSNPLTPEIRDEFDNAAKNLLKIARKYEAVAAKTTSLAVGGSSFAVACIQKCGIPPTTYQAPVLKYSEGAVAR
jgi:hypothetical protein